MAAAAGATASVASSTQLQRLTVLVCDAIGVHGQHEFSSRRCVPNAHVRPRLVPPCAALFRLACVLRGDAMTLLLPHAVATRCCHAVRYHRALTTYKQRYTAAKKGARGTHVGVVLTWWL